MVLVWLCVVGLGFDPRMAFVGGALTPGGHALLANGVDHLHGEGSNLVVEIIVQLRLGGWHHRFQACEEAVPKGELGDGSLQVCGHSSVFAPTELSLGRQLLEHSVQNLFLPWCEAAGGWWCGRLPLRPVDLRGHLNYY